jgi:hypothetical protein
MDILHHIWTHAQNATGYVSDYEFFYDLFILWVRKKRQLICKTLEWKTIACSKTLIILIQQFSLYAMVCTKNRTNLDRLYVVKYKVSGLDHNQLIDIGIWAASIRSFSLPSWYNSADHVRHILHTVLRFELRSIYFQTEQCDRSAYDRVILCENCPKRILS